MPIHFVGLSGGSYMGLVAAKPVFGVCEQHPARLISAFDIRLLESFISKLASSEISKF